MVKNKEKLNVPKTKKMTYYEAFSIGNSLTAEGKYPEALIYLEKAHKLSPSNDICINNIGICYFKLGKVDKCEQQLRKALDIKPNNSLTIANLASCLSYQNKYEESIEYFKKIIRVYQNEFDILFRFSSDLYKIGEYKMASKYLIKAIKLSNNRSDANILLAECLLELNKYSETISVLEKIKTNDKNSKKSVSLFNIAQQAKEYGIKFKKQNKKNINSLCEYIETINELSKKNKDGTLIYRGQRNKFHPLLPSLFRDEKIKANEDNIIQEFNLKADAYFNHEMAHFDSVDRVALMQHHGIPTRLLDFTEAPLVALYFALENITNKVHDVAPCVYILNLKTFKHNKNGFILSSKQVSSQSDDKIFKYSKGNYAFSPKLKNKRLTAQKGLFVVFNEEKALDETVEKGNLIKLEIPLQRISHIQEELHNLGITPSNIYPDFMGLAQEVKTPRSFVEIEDSSSDNQFKYIDSISSNII